MQINEHMADWWIAHDAERDQVQEQMKKAWATAGGGMLFAPPHASSTD